MNYNIDENEIFAIMKIVKQQKHYFENFLHKIQMITNHCNLKNFLITKNLFRREIK